MAKMPKKALVFHALFFPSVLLGLLFNCMISLNRHSFEFFIIVSNKVYGELIGLCQKGTYILLLEFHIQTFHFKDVLVLIQEEKLYLVQNVLLRLHIQLTSLES